MFTETCQTNWQLSVHIVAFAQILDDILITPDIDYKKGGKNGIKLAKPLPSVPCARGAFQHRNAFLFSRVFHTFTERFASLQSGRKTETSHYTQLLSDFILHMNNSWYPCIQYNELTRWERERERAIKIDTPPNVLQGIIRQQQPTLLALNWCDGDEVIQTG